MQEAGQGHWHAKARADPLLATLKAWHTAMTPFTHAAKSDHLSSKMLFLPLQTVTAVTGQEMSVYQCFGV